MIEITNEAIVLIGIAHVVAGAGLMVGFFEAIEVRLQMGALFAAGYVGVLLLADMTLGSVLFQPTFGELKALIWSAAIGGALGLALVATVFEPEFGEPGDSSVDVEEVNL